MNTKKSFLIALFGLLLAAACKQDYSIGDVQLPATESTVADRQSTAHQLIQPFFTKFKFAGLSCALVKGDSIVWARGYGKANIQNNVPAGIHTAYLIASISKTVTGTAMMKLVEQGLLDLDADISTYLPFPVKNPFKPTFKITCRQLLSHTSSIVDDKYDNLPDATIYAQNVDHPMPLGTFCKKMFKPGQTWYSNQTWVNRKPGTFYEYSNIGLALAGYIVERVAGQPFDEFCKTNIFTPLQMGSTHWRLAQIPASIRAMPYKTNNGAYGHYTFVDYPDGGIRASVSNMSKFLRMFMLDGSTQGHQILQPSTVAIMKTAHFPTVADAQDQYLSWYGFQTAHYNLVGHSGGEKGVLTEMYFDPVSKAGVLLFMNKDVVNENAYDHDVTILIDELIQVAAGF